MLQGNSQSLMSWLARRTSAHTELLCQNLSSRGPPSHSQVCVLRAGESLDQGLPVSGQDPLSIPAKCPGSGAPRKCSEDTSPREATPYSYTPQPALVVRAGSRGWISLFTVCFSISPTSHPSGPFPSWAGVPVYLKLSRHQDSTPFCQ